jgi:hypothetical protein
MTSPSKRVDLEKDNTMFGQLSNIEVCTFIIYVETNQYAQ